MQFIVEVSSREAEIFFTKLLGKKPEALVVEAVDRWGAVRAASEAWKIPQGVRMQDIFNSTSVRKAKVSPIRIWRTLEKPETK